MYHKGFVALCEGHWMVRWGLIDTTANTTDLVDNRIA